MKRKVDVTLDSVNVTTVFDVNPAECRPDTGAALICSGMLNGFLSVSCGSPMPQVTFVDVTQFNIWIDQIWRCELKPEIGGCQSTSRPSVEPEIATVEYNERMDLTHEVVTSMATPEPTPSSTTSVTPPPEPAPEPIDHSVHHNQAEMGHVYHESDRMHDYEQNQRTHENYRSPPQEEMVHPKASAAAKLQNLMFLLMVIPSFIVSQVAN